MTVIKNASFSGYASIIRLPDCSKLAINQKNDNDATICWHESSSFFWRWFVSLAKFRNWSKFMSISPLVLELWQFSFVRDWPEIRKLEIPPGEFRPISGDYSKLGMPSLAQMSLIKCYYMLQNTRVTAFTVSELLGENQQGGG